MRVAILAGTSHIARSLTPFFLADGDEVTLFARHPEALAGTKAAVVSGFDRLNEFQFDLLLNCAGAGTPTELKNEFHRWFTVLEEFDNRALDYLRAVNPGALYVHFSSGAVYDRDRNAAPGDDAVRTLRPNAVAVPDYYSLSKLYSEAKHRAFGALRILDVRVFSYFSRHARLDSGYFMTDLARALKSCEPLRTAPGDMLRDYPAPADLYALIRRCAELPEINTALDLKSAAPVLKSEILRHFTAGRGLRVELESARAGSPYGQADVYAPGSDRAAEFTGVKPRFTSLQTLDAEIAAML